MTGASRNNRHDICSLFYSIDDDDNDDDDDDDKKFCILRRFNFQFNLLFSSYCVAGVATRGHIYFHCLFLLYC